MRLQVTAIGALIAPLILPSLASGAADCGKPGTITVKSSDGKSIQAPTRVFDDGSVVVRARLAVNPDGGAASYTVGDHGFTYIANGMNRWNGKVSTSCDLQCGADFKMAERSSFAPGTPAFCVFAIEVEPYAAGQSVRSCGGGKAVVGNGLGKPKLGAVLETVTGEKIQAYASTTSLKHLVNGQARYLDSESIPIAVVPSVDLLGKVVWIGGSGYKPSLALIGDVGPAFGEGSIALHQLMRYGSVSPQKPGPIPLGNRCGSEELALRAPFQSRPDAKNDACRTGHSPSSPSDIRAYGAIGDELDFVILGKAVFDRQGSVIKSEVSEKALTAASAGYSRQDIEHMLSCLPK